MATGLMLCDDLIFTSRITSTAQALGLDVKAVRTSAELLARARNEPPPCVLLDLHNAGLDIAAAVAALKAGGACFVVGYGSHVDTRTLQAARDGGCDLVLPRSKFVADLETELPRWFGAKPGLS